MPGRRLLLADPDNYSTNRGGGIPGLIGGIATLFGADPSRVISETDPSGNLAYRVKNRYWDRVLNQGKGSLMAETNNAAIRQALFEQDLAKQIEKLRTDEMLRGEQAKNPILGARRRDENLADRENYEAMTPLMTNRETALNVPKLKLKQGESDIGVNEYERKAKIDVDKRFQTQPLDIAAQDQIYWDRNNPPDMSDLNRVRTSAAVAKAANAGAQDTFALDNINAGRDFKLQAAEQAAKNLLAQEQNVVPAKQAADVAQATALPKVIQSEINYRNAMANKPYTIGAGGAYDPVTGERIAPIPRESSGGGLNPDSKLGRILAEMQGSSRTNNIPENPKLASPPNRNIPPAPPGRINVQDENGNFVGALAITDLEKARARGLTPITQ